MPKATLVLPAGLLIVITTVLLVWQTPLQYATEHLHAMSPYGEIAFVVILATAVIFVPVTAMPLIPAAATMFGPLMTALLSVAGWTSGAVIAFLLARHIGRPLLQRLIDLSIVDQFAARIPDSSKFIYIVLLRLVLPVDITSYALGLTNSVSLLQYSVATMLGVTWFSFAFAYLGQSFLTKNIVVLIGLSLLSLIIFAGARYLLYMHDKRNT